MNTETIRLEAINEDAGIDLESDFIKETEGHIERGYGDAEYKGTKGQGSDARESVYVTRVGSEEDSEEATVDPTTGEVPTDTLRDMLAGTEEDGDNGSHAEPIEPGQG
jgi:hypothetical protein